MEIIRDKEFVNQYHFDARNHEWEKENGIPETKLKVDFQLIEQNKEENKTAMITILRFMIVLNHFVISGAMSQAVQLPNRYIQEPTEFTDEEKRELVEPLLNILKRMTYEVTEIAFDAPGVNLEF
ncbi:TPA: DUF1149 family protein [Streptococcus suis]|uniref:DUF1149 family protein n=1 Tax=Streptococcus suis TaxID=1307 RepID=UPI000CF5BCB9|nr:DUF1149 family protein [Streptococcus suis]MDW8750257.1 DUF1149 family protein [Streptococcus suis]NQJ72159.1 DUF1149 family protein [Streptococcus suis]NRG67995.1 DUF1149 family protein [Streptococcus suis]HEL2110323.1 DUF1149 family protein [Streptococcus suis]HEL9630311.1 DUF1149 family protein [Streptococcus suis]